MLVLLSLFSVVACSTTKEAVATTEQPSEATPQKKDADYYKNKYANYGEKYRNEYAPKVHNASDKNEVNNYYMNKYAGKYIKQEKARKQAEHAAEAKAAAEKKVVKKGAVVLVVDPVWDDAAGYVAHVPLLADYEIVKVMVRRGKSMSYVPGHITPYRKFTYDSDLPDAPAAAEEFCPKLKSMGIPVAAVVPTSDGTVALSDLLAACTGVRGNPATGPLAQARRDKWVMGEAVRKAGLRAVREKKVSTWDEAHEYLEAWSPPLSAANPAIFKILAGSSGEGIYKVTSMEMASTVFAGLSGSKEKFGGVNSLVLIQEYLQGREYAVDSVSRDGVHKVVTVWFEDFRPANGVFDQYFGFQTLDPADPFTQVIIDYSNKVLDALGVVNGGANTEIKFLEAENQPCLVEVNARWAGINWDDGLAVEHACTGMDQVTATFSAYLDEEAFNAMPAVRPLKQNGAMIMGVNYQTGTLKGLPGLAAAKEYASYISSDGGALTGIGKPILPTTPGSIPIQIAFAHKDIAVVHADYARVIALEKDNSFFDIEVQSSQLLAAQRLGRTGLNATGLLAVMASALALLVLALFTSGILKPEVKDDSVYLAVE